VLTSKYEFGTLGPSSQVTIHTANGRWLVSLLFDVVLLLGPSFLPSTLLSSFLAVEMLGYDLDVSNCKIAVVILPRGFVFLDSVRHYDKCE